MKQRKRKLPLIGVVLYRGPSIIDGGPIVVIATFKSKNRKTGRADTSGMIQTWILRSDRKPMDAIRTDADQSICGDCPHRGVGKGKRRSCYVNVGQAPNSVWKAHTWRHRYPDYNPAVHAVRFADRKLRLGSYGDPAAIPYEVWDQLVRLVPGWTGYTHQWQRCDPRFKGLCMASADTVADRDEAIANGWRTFRVKGKTDPLLAGEFVCPASEEAGKRKTCEDCRACSGTRLGTTAPRAATVAITVHGTAAHKAAFNKRT